MIPPPGVDLKQVGPRFFCALNFLESAIPQLSSLTERLRIEVMLQPTDADLFFFSWLSLVNGSLFFNSPPFLYYSAVFASLRDTFWIRTLQSSCPATDTICMSRNFCGRICGGA